ncbi:chromatin accessibility complex protein 1 [Exaiptasia diaphana]|uniref:Chromatin accessibility complex protein 1 n=1 Tax=Exaiptasia diaphana TaxID=2652724 RepID=A0A913XU06_EXADI|nr:chromatin accessibility complex protein 1 [Exaiptasia diaphana]KXJ08902.1 Chromatin accessibility complex protein 1 [Exaiptasia diaphana]
MAEEQGASEREGKLTQISLSKIKTIMRSSPDLANTSQDSVFLITRATELFVRSFTQAALKKENGAKLLSYKSVAKLVDDEDNLQFLADIIPPKVLYKDYLASLKKNNNSEAIDIDSSDSDSD